MSKKPVRADVQIKDAGTVHEHELHTHPAFAVVEVTRFTCTPPTSMFGSALRHSGGIHICIKTAELHRSIGSEFIHSDRVLIDFMMSESQWATLVSSIGQGEGVPVTLQYAPAVPYKLADIPGIIHSSIREVHAKHIKDKAANYLSEANRLIAEMMEAINSDGSLSKKRMRELVEDLENTFGGLPNTMEFLQNNFNEAMEETVAAGKSELEGFAKNLFVRAGLQHLADQVKAPQIEGEVTNAIEHKEKQ